MNRKKLQIIFTTHSEYALNPLPPEAIWACVNGKAIQGKLDILSLRSLTGDVNSELVIYVEDIFAKEWVLAMLRCDDDIAVDAIDIYAMGGDGTAVNANKYHNQDPSRVNDSICVLDGDSRQEESRDDCIFRLPGEAPELLIFYEILDRIDMCSGMLAVRCMQKYTDAEKFKEVLLGVRNTNRDHHLLFSQIGERLGFINEEVIRTAFLQTWCEVYNVQVNEFVSSIKEYLPKSR